MSRRIRIILIITLPFWLTLSACQKTPPDTENNIYLGVAWSSKDSTFYNGVKLATEEINQSGGILGKQLKLVFKERDKRVAKLLKRSSVLLLGSKLTTIAHRKAQQFMQDSRNLLGVIGHRNSFLALPAANIYEQNQRLYIAPTATNTELTNSGAQHVLRMLPDNIVLASKLATYADAQGYERIVLLNDRSEYAQELSSAFSFTATGEYGMKLVLQQSFFATAADRYFRLLAVDLVRLQQNQPYDVIILITGTNNSLKIFRELRQRGLTETPIIGSEGLDNKRFWNSLIQWLENHKRAPRFTVPSAYSAQLPQARQFITRYYRQYGHIPDRYAAIGYDSITTLAYGSSLANSLRPIDIADELRFMEPCIGVTGSLAFYDNGDAESKEIFMKTLTQEGIKTQSLIGEVVPQEISKIMASESDTTKARPLKECLDWDADNDAIIDALDQCPNNTPAELQRGIHENGPLQGCPLRPESGSQQTTEQSNKPEPQQQPGAQLTRSADDQDADGIADTHDACPYDKPFALKKGINEQGCPIDSDTDGIPDYRDFCPDNTAAEIEAGVNSIGCPADRDHDNVLDYQDQCRDTPPEHITQGIDSKGCPLDSDKDGVANIRDDCPQQSAEAIQYGVNASGCAIDHDQDGVPDYQDACPEMGGNLPQAAITQDGCPSEHASDVSTAEKEIAYTTTMPLQSGVIAPTSAVQKRLEKLVEALGLSRIQQITVIGHTDNQGKAQINQRLSNERALWVADFLADLGIPKERITSLGKGETEPIASNQTAAGRASNRRFELIFQLLTHQHEAGNP